MSFFSSSSTTLNEISISGRYSVLNFDFRVLRTMRYVRSWRKKKLRHVQWSLTKKLPGSSTIAIHRSVTSVFVQSRTKQSSSRVFVLIVNPNMRISSQAQPIKRRNAIFLQTTP